ncbi:hypothetical protein H0X32_04190 [Patescibacteria group bacterium]|nr:hypothetical protein [Patescibacteria group bacterium]
MNKDISTPIKLDKPCWNCGYTGGNLIKRDPKHPGLIKCGSCDTYQGVALNINLMLLAAKTAAALALKPLTVRVHAELAREDWAKLWYLLRAFDTEGQGHVELPLQLCQELLDVSQSTIYRWLASGREIGAYRSSRVRDGVLDIWLGGLTAICRNLKKTQWGTVAVTPLGKS